MKFFIGNDHSVSFSEVSTLALVVGLVEEAAFCLRRSYILTAPASTLRPNNSCMTSK